MSNSREAFEAWMRPQFGQGSFGLSFDGEQYALAHIQSDWLVWQARDAEITELQDECERLKALADERGKLFYEVVAERDQLKSCQVALRDALKGMIELYDTDGDHTVTTGVQCKRRALDALSKSQPQPLREVIKCECCDGKGTIDERLGGYGFSNPAAQCPDCDGYGEVEITSQPLKAAGITYPNGLPEIVPCSVAPLGGEQS